MKEFLECAEPGNSENAVNSLVNSLEVINTWKNTEEALDYNCSHDWIYMTATQKTD